MRRLSTTALVISGALICVSLTACAGPRVKRGPATPPAPLAADPRICADIEPAPAVAGGLVQPVTQEQRDAVQAFLHGELELWSWGSRGWERARISRDAYCAN